MPFLCTVYSSLYRPLAKYIPSFKEVFNWCKQSVMLIFHRPIYLLINPTNPPSHALILTIEKINLTILMLFLSINQCCTLNFTSLHHYYYFCRDLCSNRSVCRILSYCVCFIVELKSVRHTIYNNEKQSKQYWTQYFVKPLPLP
jgi:hypothetical protein